MSKSNLHGNVEKTMDKKKIKSLVKTIPLKRIATIQEQVWPIMFISSDASSYITGSIIDVNTELYERRYSSNYIGQKRF